MALSKKILKNTFGRKNSMKIAQGSKSWIFTSLIGGLFFTVLSIVVNKVILQSIFLFASIVLFLLTGLFLLFFRDPERKVGCGIVAVADGKIREIKKIRDEDLGDCTVISTFMNVYNVHVNRMPIDGVVNDVVHVSGSYLPAFRKESERNERVILKLETAIGMVKVIQIAGTLARRIVPYVHKGDKLKKGDKIGIIRLGSRVDIYLKTKKIKHLTVKKNDRIKAGERTIAEIND
jgi:phosphatidylserine decarboxylase